MPYRVFISEDPIRFAGGINYYAYVGNSPINKIDPLGLFGCVLVGCSSGSFREVGKEYGNWEFFLSHLEGPSAGSLMPIYALTCWWKRYITTTYGYVKTCTFACSSICGGTTMTVQEEWITLTFKSSEQTATGRTFTVFQGSALGSPDLYCKEYLKP